MNSACFHTASVLVLCFSCAVMSAGEAESEALPSVAWGEIAALKGTAPRKTPYYEIAEAVRIRGDSYIFDVSADHADYEVESIGKLVKLCHEIRAIEEFRKTEHGSQAWKGAKDSARQLGAGVKKVVLHPGQSVKAIGRGIGRIGRSVGRFFSRKKKEEPSVGPSRDRGAGGIFAGQQARTFAYQLGLDVYSDNPYVQGLITEVAKDRWKGSLGVSGAVFLFSPVVGLGAVLRGSLTPFAREEATELLIRDNGPPELRRALRLKYIDEYGLTKGDREDELFQRFMKNPNFSPREQAYICLYLVYLKSAQGRSKIVRHLADVRKVEDAMYSTRQMELISTCHRFGWTASEIIPAGRQLIIASKKKELIAACPYDCGINNTDLTELRGNLTRLLKSEKYTTATVAILDRIPAEARKLLKIHDIGTKDLLLKTPPFAAGRASANDKGL